MIKFFRKIRQKLIATGNLKRYLIYAVGEIMLIMIGIILALQINNWNNERMAQNNEKILFKNITEDLWSDYQTAQTLLKQAKVKQEIHLRLYNESILKSNVQVQEPYSAEIVETTRLISKTWDNHKSSIEKLSDNDIRTELNEYFRNYQTLQDYSTSLNEVILNELRPYLRVNELINFKAVFESDPNRDNVDMFSFFNHEKLRAHFGNKAFNALILELYLSTQDVIQWLETLSEHNQKLRSSLETVSK